MNFEKVTQIMGELSMMRFFPADDDARDGIIRIVGRMATSEVQVRWLVDRMLLIYHEWPGPLEMRACFCSRFKPGDGIEANSTVFPDGEFPLDPSRPRQIEAPPPPRQIEGEAVSASPSISATVAELARAKDINRTLRKLPPVNVPGIPVVQITNDNRITAEMFEAIREKRLTCQHEQLTEEGFCRECGVDRRLAKAAGAVESVSGVVTTPERPPADPVPQE